MDFKSAADAGGWVFAAFTLAGAGSLFFAAVKSGALVPGTFLTRALDQVDKLTDAVNKLTNSVDALSDEVAASRGERRMRR